MARLCRTEEVGLSSCRWSCLVVLAVGSVRDGVVFGCMHALVFWVSNAWVPASWVNQVILHHERRRNPEDGAVQDGGGNLHGRKQKKDASRATKHRRMHRRMWDGPNDGPVRATNHAHSVHHGGMLRRWNLCTKEDLPNPNIGHYADAMQV